MNAEHRQRNDHRLLINIFKKSIPQPVVNVIICFNNSLRKILMLEFSAHRPAMKNEQKIVLSIPPLPLPPLQPGLPLTPQKNFCFFFLQTWEKKPPPPLEGGG